MKPSFLSQRIAFTFHTAAAACALLGTVLAQGPGLDTNPANNPDAKKNVDASGKYTPSTPPPGPSLTRETAETKLKDALKVEDLGSGRYRIGLVTFDKNKREVTIPAGVNMDMGVIEYALVTESGKVHESLLSTKAKPEEIHLACLLLGVPQLKGDPTPANRVRVSVSWDTNGPTAERDLSELVGTSDNPSEPTSVTPLPVRPWVYAGSVTDSQGFAASREGSLIALITDSSALVMNPRDDAKNDKNHIPNKSALPGKGIPLRVTLSFPKAK